MSEKWKFSKRHNFFSSNFLNINFFLKDAERVELYNGYDKRVEAPGAGGQIIPFLLKKCFQQKFMVFEKKFFCLKWSIFNSLHVTRVEKSDIISNSKVCNSHQILPSHVLSLLTHFRKSLHSQFWPPLQSNGSIFATWATVFSNQLK